MIGLFVGFVEDVQFGLEQSDLLAGILHLFVEFDFEQVGLFAVGEEAEVVFPKGEVVAEFVDLVRILSAYSKLGLWMAITVRVHASTIRSVPNPRDFHLRT